MKKEQTIGQLAKECDVNPQTIRFYERNGLMPQARRQGTGNYRYYGENDLERLKFIINAKTAGFSLKSIQELVEIGHEADACEEVAERIAIQLKAVQTKIKELRNLNRQLEHLHQRCLANISKNPCPVIESFSEKS